MAGYHLRRGEKEIAVRGELLEILERGRFAAVALCRDEEPYVVTMSYGYDSSSDALYFHCAAEGKKIDFIRSNPRACATVVEDLGYRHGRCDHAYGSVVALGRVSILEDAGERERGIEILLDHQEKDPAPVRERNLEGGLSGDVVILRFDIESMTGKRG